ncbi:MAG TPA: hypothetical protein VGR97_01225 [Candidatus Acidoferrales bacterium]|nr:hypothetical protein [Candidatus Acidoferrales bacterium]HEV3480929.1 hypothetical protein [Candidatus Acidoferrales bacterium]
MSEGYLVGMPEREHEACRRLVEMSFLSDGLFRSLGLQASFSWFILQIRKERLVPALRGDVDILAGPLSWTDAEAFHALVSEERANAQGGRHDSWNYQLAAIRMARAGGITWPPATGHLVGVEAKCAYLDPHTERISEEALRSTKSSPSKSDKIRRQVESLLDMELNHAVLLDIIANPPVAGPDGGAWISALAVASESTSAMSSTLGKRLPEECEAAHWVWSSGAVVGGDEFHRGAGAPLQLRASRGNSRLVKVVATRSMREEMEVRLTEILSKFPTPFGFPAIFVDCKDCGKLHGISWDGAACQST